MQMGKVCCQQIPSRTTAAKRRQPTARRREDLHRNNSKSTGSNERRKTRSRCSHCPGRKTGPIHLHPVSLNGLSSGNKIKGCAIVCRHSISTRKQSKSMVCTKMRTSCGSAVPRKRGPRQWSGQRVGRSLSLLKE